MNANLTNNDNVTVGISDNARIQEAKKELQLENVKLTKDVQDAKDDARKYAIIGIFASGIFFILGYFLSKRDLKSTIDNAVKRTLEKMIEAENTQLDVKTGDKVTVKEDANVIVARNIVEHTTDSLLLKQDEKSKEKKDDLSKGVKL
jgi:hypothetical protein